MIETAEHRLAAAEKLITLGNLEQAEAEVRSILAVDEGHVRALLALGGLLAKKGDLDAAWDIFGGLTSHDPQMHEAFYNLGLIYEAKKDLEAAQDCYQQAANLSPNHADYLGALGFLKLQNQNAQDAIGLFQKILEIDASHEVGLYGLGMTFLALQKFAEAHSMFETLLKQDPDHIGALTAIGSCFASQQKFEEARDVFGKAYALFPTDAGIVSNYCQLLVLSGAHDDALQILNRATKLQPKDPVLLHQKAQSLLVQDKPSEAYKPLQQAIKLDPDNTQIRANMIFCLRKLGQYELVERVCRTFVDEDLINSPLGDLMSDTYFALGHDDKAWDLLSCLDTHEPGQALAFKNVDRWSLRALSYLRQSTDLPLEVNVPKDEIPALRPLLPENIALRALLEGETGSSGRAFLKAVRPKRSNASADIITPLDRSAVVGVALMSAEPNGLAWYDNSIESDNMMDAILAVFNPAFYIGPKRETLETATCTWHGHESFSLTRLISIIETSDLLVTNDNLVGHVAGFMGHPTIWLLDTLRDGFWGRREGTENFYTNAFSLIRQHEESWANVIKRVPRNLRENAGGEG